MDNVTYQHVREIAEIERRHLQERSSAERLGDVIATEAGRIWFIILHVIWFAIWLVLNLGWVRRLPAFDRFPFPLLTTIVSLEAIFLSLFILMSQNRSGRQAEQRAHLDLQVNLLSEYENSKMLKMLQELCIHHNLRSGSDPEISELIARTSPSEILAQLRRDVPTSDHPSSTPAR
jgi:uncharacterized membrane protein